MSHPLHQRSGRHGLGEEVDSAGVGGRRSRRIIDVGRGNQDHRNVRRLAVQHPTELVTVPIGQTNVGQDNVELPLRERCSTRGHGPCFGDSEPGRCQRARTVKCRRGIVFNQKQFRAIWHVSPQAGWRQTTRLNFPENQKSITRRVERLVNDRRLSGALRLNTGGLSGSSEPVPLEHPAGSTTGGVASENGCQVLTNPSQTRQSGSCRLATPWLDGARLVEDSLMRCAGR
jgi:hypothetical protein